MRNSKELMSSMMDRELHKLENVSASIKDIKVPSFLNGDICWLKGVWDNKGGNHPSGIYFSVNKSQEEVKARILLYGEIKLNCDPILIDHTKNKYRILYGSKAIQRWWKIFEPEINYSYMAGFIDGGFWKKGQHLVVSTDIDTANKLKPYYDMCGDTVVYEKNNSKNCDLVLKNFFVPVSFLKIKQLCSSDF